MPKDRFTHKATIPASPSDVFEALDEPSTWEQVGGVDRVTDAVVDGEGRLQGFSFEVRAAGRSYVGAATPLQRVEDELMSWRVETDEVKGATSVALRAAGEGTEMTVTLEVESKGLLSTMFFPVIAATIGSGLPRSVDDFAERFA